MSEEYPSPDRRATLPSLAALLKEIEEEETVDFENGRTTLIERLRADRARLQTEYERYSTAVVDSWGENEAPSSHVRHLRGNAAALLVVWEALKQKDLFTHPYKERPLFAQGCAYATREIQQDIRLLRQQAEQTTKLSPATLEEYRRLRNQLALLGRLQASSQTELRDDDIFLKDGYEYKRSTRSLEQLRESTNLLELWPQLKVGVGLRIETDERVIHLKIARIHTAGDRRLVVEGHITLGQPDMPVNHPIRIVTEGGPTPRAVFSLSEQERLPLTIIKGFFLE